MPRAREAAVREEEFDMTPSMPRCCTGPVQRPIASLLLVAACVLGLATASSPGVSAASTPGGAFVTPSNPDPSTGSIRLHDVETGALLKTLFKSGSPGQVQGLTLGPDGAIYGSFFDSGPNTDGQVLRIPQPGVKAEVFVPVGSGGMFSPSGLTFGPDNNLYVVNNRGFLPHNVLRFDGRTGAFIDVFATGLSVPQDVIFGPDGNLYVSDGVANSVRRFDGRTGASMGQFVAAGSGGLNGPVGMAFGPTGDLYVASAFTDSVMQFDGRTGSFVRQFSSLDGIGRTPTDLAFGPTKDLYVAARDSGTDVYRFDGDSGEFVDRFATGLATLNVGIFFADEQCSGSVVHGAASGCFAVRFPPSWTSGR